jgi:hypothetical protein
VEDLSNGMAEKIAKIMASEPLELAGNKFDLKKDFKDMRKEVHLWLKSLQGKTFTNRETEENITFSSKGVRELVSFIGKDEAYIKFLAYVPSIIENMRHLETKPNVKNGNYPNFSFYITPAKIDGENYIIFSEVGKDVNGNFYYFQKVFKSISDIIEKIRELHNSTPAAEAGTARQFPIDNI